MVFGATNRVTIDGDGSTTTFALGFTSTETAATVYVGGIIQDVYDGSDGSYSISGTNITFQSAMPTGTQAVVISTTTASVPSFSAANLDGGDFYVNTNTLFVDVSESKVGIGTSTPAVALDVVGDIRASGNITAQGNITLGDAASDTVSFGADVASDIIPSANNTYDLGSSTDKFAEVHATSLYGSLADVSEFVHFHSAEQVVSSSDATSNASATTDYTFSDLATALTYQVFLNRTLMRPTDEYTVSGSTLTIVAGVLDENDEIEVVGLKHANA